MYKNDEITDVNEINYDESSDCLRGVRHLSCTLVPFVALVLSYSKTV